MNSKENFLKVITHDNPQWVPNGMESVITKGSPVIERPSQAGKDAFGVQWSLETEAEGGTYPTHHGNPITDLSRWREQITMPKLAEIVWDAVKAKVKDVDRDESLVCGFVEMGLFERSYLLLGIEEALMAYITEPQEMFELIAAPSHSVPYDQELVKVLNDEIFVYGQSIYK